MDNLIMFIVQASEQEGRYVLTNAVGRESAKQHAFKWLGGNPDQYTVMPLTHPGSHIFMDITING